MTDKHSKLGIYKICQKGKRIYFVWFFNHANNNHDQMHDQMRFTWPCHFLGVIFIKLWQAFEEIKYYYMIIVFFFFLNNTVFKIIWLISIISKLFGKYIFFLTHYVMIFMACILLIWFCGHLKNYSSFMMYKMNVSWKQKIIIF